MTQLPVSQLVDQYKDAQVKTLVAEFNQKLIQIETVMVLKEARGMLKVLLGMQLPNADHSPYFKSIDDILKKLDKKDLA